MEEETGSQGQTKEYIQEGQAKIFFASNNREDVFYNPVQEFNRDVSIAILRQYADLRQRVHLSKSTEALEGLSILEAFSATGLRSIRYAKEVVSPDGKPLISKIIANDWSKTAVGRITHNVAENAVSEIVCPNQADANKVMHNHHDPAERFDVVDLDPYGSPTTFLDGAVQSVKDGGLLLVTCTDMAVLCGNTPETCYTKYGSISLKSKCCHEMGLRVVLQCIEANANKYGRYIEPLISISADFYCRIAVLVHTSQKRCKETTSKLGHLYQCCGCESMTVQPMGQVIVDGNHKKYKLTTGPPVGSRCKFCDSPHHVGGPFWIAPIHNQEFVMDILTNLDPVYGTYKRIKGMLSVISEELPDVPFFYQLDRLTSLAKLTAGKLIDFRSAILNSGYRVSLSHCNKLAIKTDAPNEFIWTLIRAWDLKFPARREKLMEGSVPHALLNNKFETKFSFESISFETHPDANPNSRSEGLVRFQRNPLPNWGPMMRAKATKTDSALEKRVKNQGKYKRKNDDSEGNNLDAKKQSPEQRISNE